jgi:sulfoxide reductase catalytic subunit YedY
MFHVTRRPDWSDPGRPITPPALHARRREFLRQLGFAGAGLLAGLEAHAAESAGTAPAAFPVAKRNPAFDPAIGLTPEKIATTYNNYYEFSTTKERVHRLVDKFRMDPWSLRIDGLCENPMTVDVRELTGQFPPEERVYRFRCVEAWSMVVPWTGFPLSKLIEKARPKSEARFVKFTTVLRPEEMPGLARLSDYPWPYTEGLRMEEAMNPLVLVATGLYGKPLPKQNGGPLRIVVPWKYGYKSIKSMVRLEFVRDQPATLWETLSPTEYPFESNVDPRVPHPRWSQATERDISTGDRIPTLAYNGYGDQVAKLYRR